MKSIKVLFIIMIFAFYACGLGFATNDSFAFDRPLKTLQASPSEVTGTFSLILYGGRYADDLETVAILVPDGGQYIFEPFAPDFDYKIKKGLQAREALTQAEKFVSFHNSFWQSQLSKIIDNKGATIGFELRPLYLPFNYGVSDILDVNYFIKEKGKVKVTIQLIPSVEKSLISGDNSGPKEGGSK